MDNPRADGPLKLRIGRLWRDRRFRAMNPQSLFRKIKPFQDIFTVARISSAPNQIRANPPNLWFLPDCQAEIQADSTFAAAGGCPCVSVAPRLFEIQESSTSATTSRIVFTIPAQPPKFRVEESPRE